MNKRIARISLFLVLGALFAAVLACKQAGEIVPDAVATQRAIPTLTATPDMDALSEAEFAEGDMVEFIGTGFLIPLYENPGDTKVKSHAPRNDKAEVISLSLFDDAIWYQVKSVGGTGWVELEFIQVAEAE